MLVDWVHGIEGTETGRWTAMGLALLAAVLHAIFGAMQKGRFDPWIMRGATDAAYGLIMLPIALTLIPWPSPQIWILLAGAWVIHTLYKLLQAWAYTKGAYTVVYPVVRGTGPLLTVIGAYLLFGETFTIVQWMGVLVLMSGIFGLAAFNLRHAATGRNMLPMALGLAFVTGLFVAFYTTYDAYGMRADPNPFIFLVWFFVIDSWFFPILAFFRWRKTRVPLSGLAMRGWIGGTIALLSFGAIMLATRLDKVGEAAILRETSTVFAALIGWLFLKEAVGLRRAALMALIAAGAIIVEFAT